MMNQIKNSFILDIWITKYVYCDEIITYYLLQSVHYIIVHFNELNCVSATINYRTCIWNKIRLIFLISFEIMNENHIYITKNFP